MKFKTLFVLWMFFSLSLHVQAFETLKLRSDLWCPYTCEPGDHPGLIPEIAQKILGPKNKIDYQILSWARAVAGTRSGEYEGVLGAAVTDAPDFIFPTEAQAEVSYEFFTMKNKPWKYTGSLENKKVGVINGYTYDETITKMIDSKDPHIVVISGESATEQMIQMLVAGRLDVAYETPAVFKESVRRLKLDESLFQAAGSPEQKNQMLYVAFSPKLKNAKDLAQKFDQGMKRIRKSGELKTILEKYNLKDWK